MAPVTEQLEQRISLHLDGQLPGQDQADLFRELLRNPEARQMMDDYTANDRAVTDALRAALGARPAAVAVDELTTAPRRSMPWRQILATAAMIALAAGAWFATTWMTDQAAQNDRSVANNNQPGDDKAGPQLAQSTTNNESTSFDSLIADVTDSEVAPWWRSKNSPVENGKLVDATVAAPVMSVVHHGQVQTEQSVLGVIDEDNETIYWLQMRDYETSYGASVNEL